MPSEFIFRESLETQSRVERCVPWYMLKRRQQNAGKLLHLSPANDLPHQLPPQAFALMIRMHIDLLQEGRIEFTHWLPTARVYDLLDAEVFRRLLRRPRIIEEELGEPGQIVVIDEIQKLPPLLDEVHRLIQKRGTRFLLTGSSARKLKRGGANLLAGRSWEARLFPLVSQEIPDFDLLKFLNQGGLPQVYGTPDFREELRSYVDTYLREEVQAEAVTRNIRAFAEFLDVIALSNAQEISLESLASDCQVSPGTIKNYLQVLEDTSLGFSLKGFTKTRKRKAIARSKHFLFDLGVTNQLCRRGEIQERSEMFGVAFEHFIILEVRAYLSYFRKEIDLFYWRSTSQFEVDLVLGREAAIEIKGTSLVQDKHLKGLLALKEEGLHKRYLVVSLDPHRRRTNDGIEILPWQEFLAQLWNQDLL